MNCLLPISLYTLIDGFEKPVQYLNRSNKPVQKSNRFQKTGSNIEPVS